MIKWKISKYRKPYKKPKTVKPSRYYKYLCKIGAGFNDDRSIELSKKGTEREGAKESHSLYETV